ncbi:MAG: tyrosine-type recombinase/integrase [Parvibaculaceae bacterium]
MPDYKLKRLVEDDPRSNIYITWTDDRRSKRRSTGTTSMAEAQIFFANWLLAERADPAATTSATVADLWSVYRKKHEVASPVTLDASWKNLEPVFGRRLLSEITQDMIEDYTTQRTKGSIGRPSTSATIRREITALKACLSWCASPKRKLIPAASLPHIDLPPGADPKDRWLRADELQILVNAVVSTRDGGRLSRLERFVWLALETAARKTAIYELTWDRVDFETSVVHYNVPGRRKTKKRRASVPISKSLLPVLQRAFEERLDTTSLRGHVLDNAEDLGPALKTLAKKAGLEDVTPHVLRHTSATHMARRGIPLWKIAKVLGNTVAQVERVYAHHAPEGLTDAIESISGGSLEAAL